jgi:hypothetical protein
MTETQRRPGVVRIVGPHYSVIERLDIGEGVFWPGKNDLPVGARVSFVQRLLQHGGYHPGVGTKVEFDIAIDNGRAKAVGVRPLDDNLI